VATISAQNPKIRPPAQSVAAESAPAPGCLRSLGSPKDVRAHRIWQVAPRRAPEKMCLFPLI